MDPATENGLRTILLDVATKATDKLWTEIESIKTLDEGDDALREAIMGFSSASTPESPRLMANFAAALLKRPEVIKFYLKESNDIPPTAFAIVARGENYYIGTGDHWITGPGDNKGDNKNDRPYVGKDNYRRPTDPEVSAFINALSTQQVPALLALLSTLTW